MKNRRKIGFVVISALSGLFATVPIALAQPNDTKSQQHMHGGT